MVNDSVPPFASASEMGAEGGATATIDIGAVFRGMLRRWWLIVGMPLVFLLAVFGATKVIPPVYKAGVQVLIFDPQRSNMAVTEASQPMRDLDPVAINTEVEIIKSDALSLRVAEELKLDQNPEFQRRRRFDGLRTWMARIPSYLGISQPVGKTNDAGSPRGGTGNGAAPSVASGTAAAAADQSLLTAAAILNHHITVDRLPLSYVIVVSATSNDPKMAQMLASQIVDDYVADQRELSEKALGQLAAWLKTRIAELKSQIDQTGKEIEKLRSEVGTDGSDNGAQAQQQQQILSLTAQLTAARADLAGKRARLGQGNRGEGGPTIAELQSNYNAALRREESLEATLQRLRATQVDAGTSLRLQELQRVADANEKLYDTYNARLNQVENSLTLNVPGKRIISAATVPSDPFFPPIKLMFLGGGGLGLVAGIVLAFIVTQMKIGIRPGAPAEQKFGYPIIGNVPLFQGRRPRRLRQSAVQGGLLQILDEIELTPHGEAVRMINIGMRPWSRGLAPKVILVTSAVPGEGKSTIATLLAAASAGSCQRTVLVDCDFYGRTISDDLGGQPMGLVDLLTGAVPFDEVIQSHPSIGCSVISAGSSFRRRGDLLLSAEMADTVTRLRDVFDYVVIDTPPLLSVADALAVANLVDKIIVVVDAGATKPDVVTEALRLLRSGRDRIAGIVLNKVAASDLQRMGMYAYAYSNMSEQPALPMPTLSSPISIQ